MILLILRLISVLGAFGGFYMEKLNTNPIVYQVFCY